VASQERLEGGRVQRAIVEWGGASQDKSRVGTLVGRQPEDYKNFNLVQSWDVSKSWVMLNSTNIHEYFINLNTL
jgi:hypothetical protein